MAQARGSAPFAVATVLWLLLVQSNICAAKTYKVGDDEGWHFGVQDWPLGKSFKDGDVLEFNYPPERHNVFIVDENNYEACKVPEGAKKFQTGHDLFVLNKGKHFFICGFPTHCSDHGMKLEILVE